MSNWSNLGKIVYRRTYARNDSGSYENWNDTVERVIAGNLKNANPKHLMPNEEERLRHFLMNRKAGPAGRGWWFSGAPAHQRIGGAALNNCWFTTSTDWRNFVMAQDLLMLGGGVGLSVEWEFTSNLPRVKKDVTIYHKDTKDADFIVPDSREGWCELTHRILEAYLVTGRGFSYSTVCLRGAGEGIAGFGGKASGPLPLITFVDELSNILTSREGKELRPIDCADIICATGAMVVAGNVRRSAIIILGDWHDHTYLRAKRWDLGNVPPRRAMANFSIVVDKPEEQLTPTFWKTYEEGEPFGLFNRKNVQKYGRMGETKKDTAIGTNPCAEATLEDGEPCNLQEIWLPNLESVDEFTEAAVLMHRWGKRVTCEPYHNPKNDDVVKRNRRIGTGITGCLQAPQFFNEEVLDRVYNRIQKENEKYSKKLNIAESIRTTVIKPSGTLSLVGDTTPGIHPSYSDYYIRRVRFAANDNLILVLRDAGHPMEPVKKFDGTLDHNTMVVDFFCKTPEGTPVSADYDTWKQLDAVRLAQEHWSDQAVSVTVYYKKEELQQLKEWLTNNFKYYKTLSFLLHSEHGFEQAPLEETNQETFEKMSDKIKDIDIEKITDGSLEDQECEGGACPVK